MLYHHHSDVQVFEQWRWKNFTPEELSCPCCGEYYHDENALDMLQDARDKWGKPFKINSAHRCKSYNAKIGGAKKSEHLRIAFDIAILNQKHKKGILKSLHDAGFTTFGLYNTFIHTDTRPWRLWIMGSQRIWETIYDQVVKKS